MATTDLFDRARRKILTLRRGRERAIANRHPWIFEGSIARESGPADAAIGELISEGGERLAWGFYSAQSQIRLRALSFGEAEPSFDLIRERVRGAISRRTAILHDGTTAARLVHSEGDDLSGLVIDQYGDILVVEITSAGLEKLKPQLLDALREIHSARAVFFKNDLPARRVEGLSPADDSVGTIDGDVEIRENGLRFLVSPTAGQKTGFFLDQRENRALARNLAAGRRFLNLFSYTGGFGVYAAVGGAQSVEEVDVSAPAIEGARRNHAANGSDAKLTVADAFTYVRQLASAKATFDLIVCDPPAFAKSRGEVQRAARGYKDINLYALRLVEPGAFLMTFSCSGHMSLDLFQKVVFSAALDAGRRVSFLRRLGAGSDHPVSLFCPESEYLKGFLLQVH